MVIDNTDELVQSIIAARDRMRQMVFVNTQLHEKLTELLLQVAKLDNEKRDLLAINAHLRSNGTFINDA